MRKSTVFFLLAGIGVLALGFLLGLHPHYSGPRHDQALAERKRLVGELGLTDLCLFTEARYTRHLSQADLHSAFQDHPVSFEHFPSGSLVLPPAVLIRKSQ